MMNDFIRNYAPFVAHYATELSITVVCCLTVVCIFRYLRRHGNDVPTKRSGGIDDNEGYVLGDGTYSNIWNSEVYSIVPRTRAFDDYID